MKSALDSSVIVSALCAGDPDHLACRRVLSTGRHSVFTHSLSETFSTLTGCVDTAQALRIQVEPV